MKVIKYKTITLVGNLKPTTLRNRLALIGSRKLSLPSLDYTEYLGYEMVKQGYTVVTGLAMGADSQAILGAVRGIQDGYPGFVIALAPAIPYQVYPKQNQNLYDLVKEYGILVYPYDKSVLSSSMYRKVLDNSRYKFENYPFLIDRSMINGQICSEVHVVMDTPYITGGSRYAPYVAGRLGRLCYLWCYQDGRFVRKPTKLEKNPSNTEPLIPNLWRDLDYILERIDK